MSCEQMLMIKMREKGWEPNLAIDAEDGWCAGASKMFPGHFWDVDERERQALKRTGNLGVDSWVPAVLVGMVYATVLEAERHGGNLPPGHPGVPLDLEAETHA